MKKKLLEELVAKIQLRMAFNTMQHAAETAQHLASLVSHTVISTNFVLMEAAFDAWKQQLTDQRYNEQQACQYSALAQCMRFRAGNLFSCIPVGFAAGT